MLIVTYDDLGTRLISEMQIQEGMVVHNATLSYVNLLHDLNVVYYRNVIP